MRNKPPEAANKKPENTNINRQASRLAVYFCAIPPEFCGVLRSFARSPAELAPPAASDQAEQQEQQPRQRITSAAKPEEQQSRTERAPARLNPAEPGSRSRRKHTRTRRRRSHPGSAGQAPRPAIPERVIPEAGKAGRQHPHPTPAGRRKAPEIRNSREESPEQEQQQPRHQPIIIYYIPFIYCFIIVCLSGTRVFLIPAPALLLYYSVIVIFCIIKAREPLQH